MEDLLNAVTLVVKTPNQKIADQTVECGMEWTIRKLKSHLSSVYPSNPHEKEQKIIYSGKLLQDDTVLKDILKQYDDDQTTHIVHLVCADANTTTTTPQPKSPGATSTFGARDRTPIPPPGIASEGVRQRNVTSAHMQPPQTPAAGGPMVYNAMYPPGMMPYSPDQIFWMQQMYAQQMMAYMQYMQQGSYPAQLLPGAPTPNALLTEPAQPNAPNQPANQQAAAEQPIRMNAQGGADDEDVGNNDWLDWVYTLCRFSVLLSIIYFYSTIGRFVMVFGFFILMYLFQSGWFRLRRRNGNRPEQQQQEQQRQQQQQQQVPGNLEQAEPAEPARPEGDAPAAAHVTAAPTTPPEPTEPQPPGVLRVMFSFVTMLFVSLVPQRPPAANAN